MREDRVRKWECTAGLGSPTKELETLARSALSGIRARKLVRRMSLFMLLKGTGETAAHNPVVSFFSFCVRVPCW